MPFPVNNFGVVFCVYAALKASSQRVFFRCCNDLAPTERMVQRKELQSTTEMQGTIV